MKLLLLHGFTGAPASWDEVRAGLPATWEICCPALLGHDHKGHQGPQHLGDIPPAADFTGEVDRLAAGLGAGPWYVVGYSLGARLALGLICHHAGRFCGATLIGCHPGLPEADRAARARSDEEWAQLLMREGVRAFCAAWEAQPLFASQRRLPEAVLSRQRALREGHDAAGLALALRALSLSRMPDLRPCLPGLALPVELVVGEQDGKFRALMVEMAAALPRARLHVVSGVGHNVPLEAPEAVAALIQGAAGASAIPQGDL
jgi:2-succinyl-6-hydroxy-2,4-cyclohexadiene-1-carboxylate synthase